MKILWLLLVATTTAMLGACVSTGDLSQRAGVVSASLIRQDLEIVDCLLPGQVRQLGAGATYLTQRRPVHATASDCRLRGGEYVAFDRANLQTALRVWLQAAEENDAEAQTNVGELYERGMDAGPDFILAASWYEKAAAQGNARAKFNLGTLYEQGLGVQQDRLKALNLYRESWGLPEDSVIYQAAAAQEVEAVRAELEGRVRERDQQINLLEQQLRQLQEQLAKRAAAERSAQAEAEIESLKTLVAGLQEERRLSVDRLAGLVRFRSPQTVAASGSSSGPAMPSATAKGLDFGHYYALIIGNQNYRTLDSLKTPISDAQRAAKVLADKYQFNVQIIEDASDVAMLRALNDLNARVKPNDNVLIYYAGHGFRMQNRQTESGYWLPINADAPPQDTFWVPNEQVTAHLSRLEAKRVLVVADSCYAGLLSADPGYLFFNDKVGYTNDYMKFKLPKRSRLLLSSGGDRPVLDSGGGENSVFARAFLEELEGNTGVLPAPELFARVRKRVAAAAARDTVTQVPEFKSIKGAGHELGDFFFVPGTGG